MSINKHLLLSAETLLRNGVFFFSPSGTPTTHTYTDAFRLVSDLSGSDSLTGVDVGLTHAKDVASGKGMKGDREGGMLGSALPPL